MNLVDEIFNKAKARSNINKIALSEGGESMTYARLEEQVNLCAQKLNGFWKRENPQKLRIALECQDSKEFVISALAILQSGACLVPIATEMNRKERQELIARTNAHYLFHIDNESDKSNCLFQPSANVQLKFKLCGTKAFLKEISAEFYRGLISPAYLLCNNRSPKLKPAKALWQFMAKVLGDIGINGQKQNNSLPEREFSQLNPALIRFSSGTTGTSKGVILSHESIIERIKTANKVLQINPNDKILWLLPMAHHFAVSVILYLYHGAEIVLANKKLNEQSTENLRKITVIYTSPNDYQKILADQRLKNSSNFVSLRLAISTSFALPSETAQIFLQKFGQPIVQALGIIEIGLPIINFPHSKTLKVNNDKNANNWKNWYNCIGKPISDYEVKLIPLDWKNNDNSGKHKIFELLIKGPGMLDAYLQPWQSRKEILAANGGFFKTGDLVTVNDNGDFFIAGRSNSVINLGGVKFFPEEVEDILCQHPLVKQAQVTLDNCNNDNNKQRKVTADEGKILLARVVLSTKQNTLDGKDSEKSEQAVKHELLNFCRENLPAHKIPSRFELVASLPRTHSGKILRNR